MCCKIIVTQYAELELKEAKFYYNSRKRYLGDEYIDEVKKLFALIKKNPRLFPIVLGKTRKVVLNRFPYNIYFVIDENTIFVTYPTKQIHI